MRLHAERQMRDEVCLPLDDLPEKPPKFETVEHKGKDYIKIPKRVLDDYLLTRRAAEMVWAVLHASPKFKGANYDKLVQAPPWQKQKDEHRWKKGKEAAEKLRKGN